MAPLPGSQDSSSASRYTNQSALDMIVDGDDEPDFHFDDDGNLQLAPVDIDGSSLGLSASDMHTEVLAQIAQSAADDSHATGMHILLAPGSAMLGASLAAHTEATSSRMYHDQQPAKRSLDEHLDNDISVGSADSRPTKWFKPDHDAVQPREPPSSPARLLEAIEYEVAYRWDGVRAMDLTCATARHQRAGKGCTGTNFSSDTSDLVHVPRITSLWGGSCYWSKRMRARIAGALCRHAVACAQRRVAALSGAYSLPADQALRHILEPSESLDRWPEHGFPAGPMRDSDALSDGMYALADAGAASDDMSAWAAGDSDVELGRGGSPAAAAPDGASGSGILDIHLDVPWLNPTLLAEVQRQRPAIGSQLTLADSSAAVASQQPPSISRQSTPASRVPSLDPPSSDDGLDIQPFELAAENLGAGVSANSALDARGLDSFLDVSIVSASTDEEGPAVLAAEMSRESRCFHQYTLAKMRDGGSDRLNFSELLEPPYRSPRVAARAFVDLLQMATCSVFGVEQEAPYAEIAIVPM